MEAGAYLFLFDDSGTGNSVSGYPLHGEDGGLSGVEDLQKLLEDGGAGVDDVVREEDGERLGANGFASGEDGVTEAQLLVLDD